MACSQGVTFHTDTLPKQCPIMAPFAADFQARKCTTHPVSDKSGAASQLCGLPPYGYVHVLLKKRGDRQASPCFALRLLLCFIREPSLPVCGLVAGVLFSFLFPVLACHVAPPGSFA